MYIFIKKALYPILVLTCVFILTLHFVKDYNQNDDGNIYTLKSYKNTVALYQGENLIKTYDEIVLNTLPPKDIQSFNSGVLFDSQSQAETYLLDFE